MSKNRRQFDASNNDRRQALEKKKAIAASLFGPKPKVADAAVALATEQVGKSTPVVMSEAGLRYTSVGVLLSVYPSHTGAPLILSDGLFDVVDLYLDSAFSRKATFCLLWPGVLSNFPLVH